MNKIGADADLSQTVFGMVHRIVRAVDAHFPGGLTKARGDQGLTHCFSSLDSVLSMKATELLFLPLPVWRAYLKGGGE